jgi:hypothetical protein
MKTCGTLSRTSEEIYLPSFLSFSKESEVKLWTVQPRTCGLSWCCLSLILSLKQGIYIQAAINHWSFHNQSLNNSSFIFIWFLTDVCISIQNFNLIHRKDWFHTNNENVVISTSGRARAAKKCQQVWYDVASECGKHLANKRIELNWMMGSRTLHRNEIEKGCCRWRTER